jgi:hypothetical protein
VLAPNAPLRSVVTALAPAAVLPSPGPISPATREEPRHLAVARYLWAILLARIYEAFPLQYQICHAAMRIIAFVNDSVAASTILDHICESTQPPRIVPARGPPLWAAMEQAGNDPQWDSSAHPAPEFEFDQRIAWWVRADDRMSRRSSGRGSCLMAGEWPRTQPRAVLAVPLGAIFCEL